MIINFNKKKLVIGFGNKNLINNFNTCIPSTSIIHEDCPFDEVSNELMVHDPLSNTNSSKSSILGTNINLYCKDM
jgi:hypothetical protein